MAKRKVYFYRAHAGVDGAGRPLPFQVRPLLQHLDALPFNEEGRYLDLGDGEVLCCWRQRQQRGGQLLFGRIRRASLPQLERRGRLQPLVIPEDAGIVEHTHVVFFRHNIVGVLFNFFGPRVSRLADYLCRKCPAAPEGLRFDPLLRQDILDQLDRLGRVRIVELRISRSYVDTIAAVDRDLGSAFRAAANVSNAEQIELVLRPRPYGRTWLSQGLLTTMKRLGQQQHLREEVQAFKIRGLDEETDSLETVDVLKDRFVIEKEVTVLDSRTRILAPQSAFGAIREAYAEMREDLEAAAALWD